MQPENRKKQRVRKREEQDAEEEATAAEESEEGRPARKAQRTAIGDHPANLFHR